MNRLLPPGITVNEALTLLVAGVGVVCLLFSSVGIVRLRNALQRMHAASIASSLAVFFIVLSAALHDSSFANWFRALLLVALFYLTAPIATTAMARAAWRKTRSESRASLKVDDMADPQWTLDYTRRYSDDKNGS